MSDEKYQILKQLFGGYLHQDWSTEFSAAIDAIKAFKQREPKDIVRKACNELNEIIPLIITMRDPERFLHEILWCEYDPRADGLTVAQWLQQVRDILGC